MKRATLTFRHSDAYCLWVASLGSTIDAEDRGTALKYANGGRARSLCNAEFFRCGRRVFVRAIRDIHEHDDIVLLYGGEFALTGWSAFPPEYKALSHAARRAWGRGL